MIFMAVHLEMWLRVTKSKLKVLKLQQFYIKTIATTVKHNVPELIES